ncbi:MAG TPA: hypothetical protein VGE60_02830 [Telluria sp.]
MKDITPKSFTQSINDFFKSLEETVRQVARAIAGMSWPALLAVALGVALVLTLLPLAIFVFLVFLLIKVMVAAFAKPRHLPPPQAPEGQ